MVDGPRDGEEEEELVVIEELDLCIEAANRCNSTVPIKLRKTWNQYKKNLMRYRLYTYNLYLH